MAPPPRLSPAGRAAAWLACGPVGHLAAWVIDLVALLAAAARRR
jgi:hypothetical protein